MIDTGMLSGFVAGLSIGLGLTFLLRSKTDVRPNDVRSKSDVAKTTKKEEASDDEGEWEDGETDSDEGK